jgi:hypothetical protein
LLALGLVMLGMPSAMLGQAPGAPPLVPTSPPLVAWPYPSPPRPPVVVGLPVPQVSPTGELFVQPNVTVGGFPVGHGEGSARPPGEVGGDWFVRPAGMAGPEALPPPGPLLGSGEDGAAGGVFGPLFSGDPSDLLWMTGEPIVPWDEFRALGQRPVSPTGEPGVGRERVMYAPFEIDITQPFGNFLFRTDAVYNLTKPDRSEYFWAKPGRGPLLPESGVAYQDFRLRMETGNDVFSLATDVPIVLLNPDVNDNTGGIGDIQLVQKTVLINGKRWQMTQLLRTIFNSGNARKGLGTGHVAMEPGMLFRFKQSELTYWHSELKMLFPIAGDPMYSGPALKWGIGVSHLWYETDTVAYIPTLEFTNIWLLDGQVTPFPAGPTVDVDGDGIFNLAPGLRIVSDTGGDLGVVELGASAVLAVGSDGWYDALIRLDLRFVF